MGEIAVLTRKGDEPLSWDPADEDSTKKAEARFNELKEQGYEFYEVAKTRGKKVTAFAKDLGELIAAPGGRSASDKQSGSRQHAMAGGPVPLHV